jgi:hypothetical protein
MPGRSGHRSLLWVGLLPCCRQTAPYSRQCGLLQPWRLAADCVNHIAFPIFLTYDKSEWNEAEKKSEKISITEQVNVANANPAARPCLAGPLRNVAGCKAVMT